MNPGTMFSLGAASMLSVVLFIVKAAGFGLNLPLFVIISPLLMVALIHGGLVAIDIFAQRILAKFFPKLPPVQRPRKP